MKPVYFVVPNNPYETIGGVEQVVKQVAENMPRNFTKNVICFSESVKERISEKPRKDINLVILPQKSFFGIKVPVINRHDLVVYKRNLDGAHQKIDIEAILKSK